jgi:hypothetical protein
MLLPEACPHAPATRWSLLEPVRKTSCCLGDGRQILLLLGEEPLCRGVRRESEVYRFIWQSSFQGDAIVRIGRQQDVVTLGWRRHGVFETIAGDDSPAEFALAPEDWTSLCDALIAAEFWSLDATQRELGLDGARWLIDGRRENVYHGVSRWSPQGGLYALGRLFFALAGPPLSKVKLC